MFRLIGACGCVITDPFFNRSVLALDRIVQTFRVVKINSSLTYSWKVSIVAIERFVMILFFLGPLALLRSVHMVLRLPQKTYVIIFDCSQWSRFFKGKNLNALVDSIRGHIVDQNKVRLFSK